MALEASRFDILDHLQTPEHCAGYLEAAFEDGDPLLITLALQNIVRSRGFMAVNRDAGLSHEALRDNDDPKLSTLLGVSKALGLRLAVTPAIDAA